MKLVLFTVFSTLFLLCSAQKSSDFDQQLTERNLLYNELQAAKINDTVVAEQLAVKYEALVGIDNVLLDEWIPLMLQNNDSLSQALLTQKTEHQIAMAELKEKHDLFFYAAIGAGGLMLILLIIVIVQSVSKKRLKKKLNESMKLSIQNDELKSAAELHNQQLAETNEKMDELESKVQQHNLQLENHEKEKKSEILILNNRISQLQQELNDAGNSEEGEIVQLNNTISQLREELESIRQTKESEISALQLQLSQIPQNHEQGSCTEHEQRINELETLIDKQRDDFMTIQREKEVLIDELRSEIHALRTNIDESERDEHHEKFSEVSDVMDENSKLKQKVDELKDILDDYRQTLEKELEMRKELELMLKEIIQK